MLENPDNLRLLNKDFEKYAPICFMYERDTEKSREISKALWNSFVNSSALTNFSFDAFKYLFSDGIVGFTVHRFVQ